MAITSSAERKRRQNASKAKVTGRGGRPAPTGSAKVTSSAKRAAQAKAGAKAAYKKTTSSGKGAGRTPNVDGRASRQGASNARVTSSTTRASGTNARVTGAKPTSPNVKGANPKASYNPKSQATAAKMGRKLKFAGEGRQAASMAKMAKGLTLAQVAWESLQSNNTADGTLKGKPTGPKQGPGVPDRLKMKKTQKAATSTSGASSKGASSFDKAFAAARSSGKKAFTWRGKSYTTKLKD
jgi:DNA-binding protein HU-beta